MQRLVDQSTGVLPAGDFSDGVAGVSRHRDDARGVSRAAGYHLARARRGRDAAGRLRDDAELCCQYDPLIKPAVWD